MTLLWLGIISKFIMLSLCATFMFLRIITMNSQCKEFNIIIGGCLIYPKSHIIHAEIAETAEMALPICDLCVKLYLLVWIMVAMPQYDFWRSETNSPKDWKTTDGGATPVHVFNKPKPWKGDRQSAAHILSPLRGSVFISILCAGVAPLPVLCRPRRGLFALVVIGGLKGQHTASPGHRPGEHGNTSITPCKGRTIMLLPLPGVEDMSPNTQGDFLGFWDTLSTGQQTATTRPHPDRDTKKSRPLKEHLERPAEVDYSEFGIAAIIFIY